MLLPLRRAARWLPLAVLFGIGVGAGSWLVLRPSNDRVWARDQAVLPAIRRDGHIVHIGHVRNFAYSARGRYRRAYYDRDYDLDQLDSAWLVLTPFSRRWRTPAHGFVSFGFAGSQFVAISVEARRELGEQYGLLAGLARQFELVYIVGDERDLIGQRAAFSDQPVYLYPIRATPTQIRELFAGMLQRADRLREAPEFYNTLTNSCISNLAAHVNRIVPHAIPGALQTLLPGYADEVAHRLGLIDTPQAPPQARERFRINEQAQRYLLDPAFSQRIREAGAAASAQ